MDKQEISNESIQYIVARLVEKAGQAFQKAKENPKSDLQCGRRLAYYEMLDILRSELEVAGVDLKEFGLDIDLEAEIA